MPDSAVPLAVPSAEILPPADPTTDLIDHIRVALRAFAEYARLPAPFMVDRSEAARLCGMSVATYDKYSRKGLLPRMNATGRISVEALRRAAWKLDGIAENEIVQDAAEAALREWEAVQ